MTPPKGSRQAEGGGWAWDIDTMRTTTNDLFNFVVYLCMKILGTARRKTGGLELASSLNLITKGNFIVQNSEMKSHFRKCSKFRYRSGIYLYKWWTDAMPCICYCVSHRAYLSIHLGHCCVPHTQSEKRINAEMKSCGWFGHLIKWNLSLFMWRIVVRSDER